METQIKSKSKTLSRPVKAAVSKSRQAHKSLASKAKPSKAVAKKRIPAKPTPKARSKAPVARKPSAKTAAKVKLTNTSKSHHIPSKPRVVQELRHRETGRAIHAYESGLKLMHADKYEKAAKVFSKLISDHSEEPEIQSRARMLMHACEKRLHERARTVLKSADDHYNMGIADLNRRELDAATQHLQQALKLAPKGDHILYAMAAVQALKGDRDESLSLLRQSIQQRPENRFMAVRDSDFEALIQDPDFKTLVSTSGK